MNLSLLKPKNFIVLIFFILLNASAINLFAQDVPNDGGDDEPDPFPENNLACQHLCPEVTPNLNIQPQDIGGVYHYYVYDALYLYEVLSCLYQDWQMNGFPPPGDPDKCFLGIVTPGTTCSGIIPSCSTNIVIHIMQDIDLGLLPASVFPLEVSPGVTIQGSYELKNIDHTTGKSIGTRIYFPYLYEAGVENGVPFNYMYQPSMSCNQDFAYAFKLNDYARFFNICLYGPTTTLNDHRFTVVWRDGCNPNNITNILPTHEGMSGGIMVIGNECEVAYCEIYGFRSAGCFVRDMVNTMSGFVITPTTCYNHKEATGVFKFHNNYVHNNLNKGKGYGYGIYVANPANKYPCGNSPQLTEMAFITNNIFKNNQRNIVYSGKNVKVSIANNRYM